MAIPAPAIPLIQQLGQTSASQGSTGLISGALGQLFGGLNARRDWKYQQKAMALQQQYALEQMAKSAEYQLTHDKEMFDYQNAYNEPSKVFERYAQAGINPAAVLGSSGVGVSATIPTGSGAAPSASGPTGAGSPKSAFSVASDPLALANLEMTKANADRASAAADRDSAEAALIRNQTQPKEYYDRIAQWQEAITRAGVTDAEEGAKITTALAKMYSADAEYADLVATYKFQDYITQYALHVEEYNQIKKYNDKYLDLVYSSQVILDQARAYESMRSGDVLSVESDIAKVRLDDLRNWFDVNWETEIPVPEVNEKGKPTGGRFMLTGKEIHSYLMGLAVTHGNQETASRWFSTRSEKNAFGYELTNTVVRGALGVAGSYAGGRAMGRGMSTVGSERSTIENYNKYGEFVGGTTINKEMLSNRNRR